MGTLSVFLNLENSIVEFFSFGKVEKLVILRFVGPVSISGPFAIALSIFIALQNSFQLSVALKHPIAG